MRTLAWLPVLTLLALPACKTSNLAKPVKSAGEAVASGVQGVGSVATSLVNVNLSNVLNDLAVQLNVDKANIPITAQIPITIAANVCGVSINILSVGAGGGNSGGCTATTSSGDLAQVVQQQMAAGTTQTPTQAPSTTTPSTSPTDTSTPTTTPSTTSPTPQ